MPQTLREISGLPQEPARLDRSALVMIDCQNTYRQGVIRLEGLEAALDEAMKLLELARGPGTPISTSSMTPARARPTTSGARSAPSRTRSRH